MPEQCIAVIPKDVSVLAQLQFWAGLELEADIQTAAYGTPANEIVHSIEWNDGKSQ